MKKIVFVCTGNICRGPMAQVIAEDIFKKKNINVKVISRGIAVYFPNSISLNSLTALRENGYDCINHKAQQITKDDIEECDLILTMTQQHKIFLNRLVEDEKLQGKIFTLKEYTKSDISDIQDPYDKNIEEHRNCILQLSKCIEILSDLIV